VWHSCSYIRRFYFYSFQKYEGPIEVIQIAKLAVSPTPREIKPTPPVEQPVPMAKFVPQNGNYMKAQHGIPAGTGAHKSNGNSGIVDGEVGAVEEKNSEAKEVRLARAELDATKGGKMSGIPVSNNRKSAGKSAEVKSDADPSRQPKDEDDCTKENAEWNPVLTGNDVKQDGTTTSTVEESEAPILPTAADEEAETVQATTDEAPAAAGKKKADDEPWFSFCC